MPLRIPAAIAAAILLVAAGCAFAPSGVAEAPAWPGRLLVLVLSAKSGGPGSKPALEALQAGGIKGIASADTQTVALANFARIERVSLSSALERLGEDDPRLDPWIEGLGRYFHAESGERSWDILFVEAGDAEARAILKEALGPAGSDSWSIAERAAAPPRFLWILPAAFAIVAALASKPRRAERFLGALAWAPLWWAGGAPAAAAAIFAALAGARASALVPYRETRRIAKRRDWLAAFRRVVGAIGTPLAALLALLALVEPSLLPIAALCAGAQAAIFEAFAAARAFREAHRARPGFRPVPISPDAERRAARAFSPLAPAAALVAALALPLSYAAPGIQGAVQDYGLSLPESIGRAQVLPADPLALERLVAERSSAFLPDLADAAAHLAYQRRLLVERVGDARYGDFGPVRYTRYSRASDGGIEAFEAESPAYTAEDLDFVLDAPLERALSASGGFTRVRSRSAGAPGGPRRLAIIEILVYILALAPFAVSGWTRLLARSAGAQATGKVREAA